MQVTDIEWSKPEKEIARIAFDRAYERETASLVGVVREQAEAISTLEQLWQLHDFLSARRYEIDGKYDYRDSALIFVFAGLVREGWLSPVELEGLDTDKLSKIAALARMQLS